MSAGRPHPSRPSAEVRYMACDDDARPASDIGGLDQFVFAITAHVTERSVDAL